MMSSLFAFDAVGGWVAATVLLIHIVALRSDFYRQRLGLLAVHAVACIGMALAHRLGVFLSFAVIATVPLILFFEPGEERRSAGIDLFVALGCVIVVALAAESSLVSASPDVRYIGQRFIIPGVLLGLASRLGMWPFGRWLESQTAHGRETRLALVLSGGAAWMAFVRHLPNEAVESIPHAEVIAGVFAASAVVMAISAGRSTMPVADFARAHVAVAVSAGLLFMGTRLIFDYSFAILVGATAISLVLANSTDTGRGLYAIAHRDRWLLAILVVLCVGCPATAIFVDEDLTLEGIAFAHTVVALAIAVVFVAAAVALMRFFFERIIVVPSVGRPATGTWLVPALLSVALVVWGVVPLWLDPADDNTTIEAVDQ